MVDSISSVEFIQINHICNWDEYSILVRFVNNKKPPLDEIFANEYLVELLESQFQSERNLLMHNQNNKDGHELMIRELTKWFDYCDSLPTTKILKSSGETVHCSNRYIYLTNRLHDLFLENKSFKISLETIQKLNSERLILKWSNLIVKVR